MFTKVMIPVDLGHTQQMEKPLALAAELAEKHGAQAYIVGVTQSGPTEIARTPEGYAEKLAAFAAEHSKTLGVTFETRSEVSHDITIDLDDALQRAAEEIGADLIVMASHVPGLSEYVFSSNAGYLASHMKMSVFVVR